MSSQGQSIGTPFPDHHKTGSDLASQRFQMLEDIAKELAGDVIFPTCFDVSVRLRKVLQDPDAPLKNLASVISLEPLICCKLLSLANSPIYNPAGKKVRNLNDAINGLGVDLVRSTALAIATNQMLRSREMAMHAELTRGLWIHSIDTACAAYVIALRLTRIDPAEAMLAGLVHDLGAFYMLYRSTQYEELHTRPDTVRYLIIQWHESIGHMLLNSLGLPEDIAESIRDHDQPRRLPATPRNLADVIYVANLLGGGLSEWLHQDHDIEVIENQPLDQCYLALREEISERAAEMHAALE